LVPYIPMYQERNTRTGFLEHDQFQGLISFLPDYLRPVVSFAYRTGWRKDEILGLTWSRVDLREGTVRLEAGETKNSEARTIYLDQELRDLLHRQWKAREERGRLSPFVFPNEGGTGKINDFRDSWMKACQKAAIPKMLFHDFRRTAVRNMVRAGVPERVAMMVSGHKTRSVFDRYNIVSPDDLKMAAARQEAYLESMTVTKQLQFASSGGSGRGTGQDHLSQVVEFIGGARGGTRTPTGHPTGS